VKISYKVITNASGLISSGTELLSLLILLGRPPFKNPIPETQGSIVSNEVGMNFGRNVLHTNMHRLTKSDFLFEVFQNGSYDVNSCRRVPPPRKTKAAYTSS